MQAFLSGEDLPTLSVIFRSANGLAFYETVKAAALEQDMQDISSNPSLAKPTDPKGTWGSVPLILPTTPPTGKAVPLQAEVEQWMCDGSLDKLHAACHKV